MDQNAGIELPPAVHDGPFSYGSKGFYVTAAPDVERLATGRLTELLKPETVLDTLIREKIKKEARRLITMPWIIAHLEFYEIAYEPKHNLTTKQGTLNHAVRRGMVRIGLTCQLIYLVSLHDDSVMNYPARSLRKPSSWQRDTTERL